MSKKANTPPTETAIINRITKALETLTPTAQIRVMRYIESASYERLETRSMKMGSAHLSVAPMSDGPARG